MANKKSKPKAARERRPRARRAGATYHGPLTRISIEGFRGIKRLQIDGLAPLTVFTGDNGAGKSTLLEATFAVYGRTTPAWVAAQQGRRGLLGFSKAGPSYLGLFYGESETGRAVLSARTEQSVELRLEIDRSDTGQQAIVIEPRSSVGARYPIRFEQGDLANTPEQAPALRFRAFKDGQLENESELIWTFTPPDHGELRARNARPGRPHGILLHSSDVPLGADDKERFGDVRQLGRDRSVIELLQTIDRRVVDVEFLQTSKTEYFRAKLADDRTFPLAMLGGGAVNAFRAGVCLAFVENGFLGIDEVENGLYYRRLPEVFRGLVQARRHFGTQLMLATHSFEALTAIVDAATEHDPKQFSVVHLRRDAEDTVHATAIPGTDAKSSLEHGFDLR